MSAIKFKDKNKDKIYHTVKSKGSTIVKSSRRASLSKESQPQFFLIHLIRFESLSGSTPREQLGFLVRVKRGTDAWLIVRSAASLASLHEQVKARCAGASVLKFPDLSQLSAKRSSDGVSANGECGTMHTQADLHPDPSLAHKIQVFMRRLIGGFPGPDVESFVSLTTSPSRKLNKIESWMIGPTVAPSASKHGALYKFNSKASQWRDRYYVLRGCKLFKYRSAKHYLNQENEPMGIYDLTGTVKVERRDPQEENNRFPFALSIENTYGVKLNRVLACSGQGEATEWVETLNRVNSQELRGNAVLGVELKNVVYTKAGAWRLSGLKPSQGKSIIAAGATQFIDEIGGFLLATGRGKRSLFDQAPDADLMQRLADGDPIIYTKVANNPEKAAGLLLAFLQQLPTSLVPSQYYDSFIAAYRIGDLKKRKKVLKLLTSMLPAIHLKVLRLLIGFLRIYFESLTSKKTTKIREAFSTAVLRPTSYGDSVSYASAAAVMVLDFWINYKDKFWSYEEGFGEPTEKGDTDPILDETKAQGDKSVAGETGQRPGRSGTFALFAQMAEGAATMQANLEKEDKPVKKSPSAKRKERRKRSLTFKRMAEEGLSPAQQAKAAVVPRLTVESVHSTEDSDSQRSQDTPNSHETRHGEDANTKKLGTAAKRRERRRRRTRELLEQHHLEDSPGAQSANGSSAEHAADRLTGASGSDLAARMSARVAEIAKHKQQRMSIDMGSFSVIAPRSARQGSGNESLSSRSHIQRRTGRAVSNAEEASEVTKMIRKRPANGRATETSPAPEVAIDKSGETSSTESSSPSRGSRRVTEDQEREQSTRYGSEKKKERTEENEDEDQSETGGSPLLRELNGNRLVKYFRSRCLVIDEPGLERTVLGFDPRQQSQKSVPPEKTTIVHLLDQW